MYTDRSYCGELTESDVDKDVQVAGWVHRKRDLGNLIFLQLRDVSGIIQLVFDSSTSEELAKIADSSKSEYVIKATGKVRNRTSENINPDLATGKIEVVADSIEILNESLVPPFPLDTRDPLSEDIRLKYRYLDLRREEMKDVVIKRHVSMQSTRKYLTENRFIEIETPILNKSTPEGARDFLVPSRINKGRFYALPQSPQLFKQILMVSGYDRYFQIVKCFRDEDLRNDRQPEFTQIDMELSFVTSDMVMESIEGLLKVIVKDVIGKDIDTPFKRLTYDEAMDKYGCDAPDMRFGLELVNCNDIFQKSEFKIFSSALSSGGIIKGISVNDSGKISRKKIDEYGEFAKIYGAKGLPILRYKDGKFEGGISKFLSDSEKDDVIKKFNINDTAIIIFSVDKENIVNDTLANVRKKIASDLDMIDDSELNFLWVSEFPLFEYDDENNRFQAVHHPFTSPMSEHTDLLGKISRENCRNIKALAYDVVLNGVEIGGGSIRIHKQDLQSRIFSILGISEQEANEKFSFLLDALKYGAPPHGGIALGLDRILMILSQKNSIRDVIPFPKTQRGQCLMSNAPSRTSEDQLNELSIKVVEKQND